MKDSAWCIEKNKELLAQVAELRKRAWEDQTPWSIGLRVLEEELRQTLDKQVALMNTVEQRIEEREGEKRKWEHDREVLRKSLEEKVTGLQTRLNEMERIRDEENYRMKKAMTLKEAEAEKLMELLKLDPVAKRRRRIIIGSLIGLGVLLGMVSGILVVREQKYWKIRRYALPYANPSAVGFVSNRLVISDWLTQSLYYHKLEAGIPVDKVLFAPKLHISGMAGEGNRILAADNWEKKIRTLFFNGQELEELVAVESPGPKPGGLFAFEGILWIADPEARKIYRQEMREGGSTKEYGVSALMPRAVVRRGEVFWVLDEKTGRVVRNKPGLDLDKQESWEDVVDPSGPEGAKPVGMMLGKDSLWILTMQPAGLVRYNLRYLGQ